LILSVFENQIITDLMDKTNISHPMYLNEKYLIYGPRDLHSEVLDWINYHS